MLEFERLEYTTDKDQQQNALVMNKQAFRLCDQHINVKEFTNIVRSYIVCIRTYLGF